MESSSARRDIVAAFHRHGCLLPLCSSPLTCDDPRVLPLQHLLPLTNEHAWCDLLAVLIEADPQTASSALGLPSPLRQVHVRKEAPVSDDSDVVSCWPKFLL